MKASELIERLQNKIDQFGDLEVRYDHYDDPDTTPSILIAYNEDGDYPDENNPASYIYIH